MNFQKWYNTKGAGSHAGHTLEKEFGGKEAWEACKVEVLKILKNEKDYHFPKYADGKMMANSYIDMAVIKEIEKL